MIKNLEIRFYDETSEELDTANQICFHICFGSFAFTFNATGVKQMKISSAFHFRRVWKLPLIQIELHSAHEEISKYSFS